MAAKKTRRTAREERIDAPRGRPFTRDEVAQRIAAAEESHKKLKAEMKDPAFWEHYADEMREEWHAAFNFHLEEFVGRLRDPSEREIVIQELSAAAARLREARELRNEASRQDRLCHEPPGYEISPGERDRLDLEILEKAQLRYLTDSRRRQEVKFGREWFYERLLRLWAIARAEEALEAAEAAWRTFAPAGTKDRISEIFERAAAESRQVASRGARAHQPPMSRAEAARRFIQTIEDVFRANSGDEYAFVNAGISFLLRSGTISGLLDGPLWSAEGQAALARIQVRRVMRRSSYDAKAIAVAILIACGLDRDEARNRLKDKDV